MATLQEALDKIGFIGTPTTSIEDLNTLSQKFSMACPLSTMHLNGTLRSANETEFVDRVITQGIGGVCIELGIAFKWMLDQIGFSSYLVPVQCNNGTWGRRLGVVVTIGADKYFCCFGYYYQKISCEVKLEDGHVCNQVTISYDTLNTKWVLTTDITKQTLCFKDESQPISYWNAICESESVSGSMVDRNMISISLSPTVARTYVGGKILTIQTDYTIEKEQYVDQDLVGLFNYYGILK